MKKNNNKGFTLMEMLIVVAIIAVLVAIAIPVFTNQLEKAREATDEANIRSAYAEIMATALTDSGRADGTTNAAANNNFIKKEVVNGVATWSKHVDAVQKQTGWQSLANPSDTITIGGVDVNASTSGWTVEYVENNTTGNATITPDA